MWEETRCNSIDDDVEICNDCLENVSVDVRNENSSKVVVVSVEHVGSLKIQLKVGLGFPPGSRVKIYQLKGTSLVSKYLLLEFLQLFPVLKLAFES